MRELYEENTANYPRLKTDRFFADYENKAEFNGFIDETIKFIEDFQLMRKDVWKRLVEQFRIEADSTGEFKSGTWKGEFWGKLMRGACFVYSYTNNEALYDILKETVEDIITTQDSYGRISAYSIDREFKDWDIWGRKYVLLGMQYFLEICKDADLSERIISSMRKQVDYMIEKIGSAEDGKTPITLTSDFWRGLNSSSVLEPIVRLYSLTGEQKYLDFASYIVDCGATDVENLFELAYQDKLYPYQYPMIKAYELTSCFEGLLEYYRVTGIEKHKTAVINFADKVLESDFTIIGSSGCTHELFDHSTVRQANTNNNILAQETCVTVTLMKFFYQLSLLTGDSKYIDAFELSMYNAYLGAVNTDKVIGEKIYSSYPDSVFEPLAFDSYSPLVAGTRGKGIGGLLQFSDKHYIGCCVAIGAAGCGLFSKAALYVSDKGFAYNLFINGKIKSLTPSGNSVEFITKTDYPVSGDVKIELKLTCEEAFAVAIRNPQWSETTKLSVNGEEMNTNKGYILIERTWKDGDIIELKLDMRTKAVYPIPYGSQIIMTKGRVDYLVPLYDEEDPLAKNHIALKRGPIVLAQENRLGYSVDTPISVKVENDGYVNMKTPEKDIAPYKHIIELCVPLEDGSFMHVTDYASAGKLWNEDSKLAAWMLTK